jgi:hypothetical protein
MRNRFFCLRETKPAASLLQRDRREKEATMPSDPERRGRGAQKLGEILGQTADHAQAKT